MDDGEPIFVLRDGDQLGPFTIDELLEEVDEGRLDYEDICLRGEAGECERVREILDWEDDVESETESTDSNSEIAEENAAEPEPTGIPEMAEPNEVVEESETRPKIEGPPKDPSLILYAGHKSLISFPKSVTLIIIALVGGFWLRETSNWFLFSGLVLALIAISHIIIERTSKLYTITPKRVEIEKGLFAKSSNEVRISDIRTINVVRRGLLGMIGVGRVEFASSGGQDVEVAFDDVWAANRIKALVRRLQDASE